MKFLFLILVISGFVAFATCNFTPEEEDEDKSFEEFTKKLRHASRSLNINNAKRAYTERLREIREHNKGFENGTIPYELGFADEYALLPYDELIAMRTGNNPPPEDSFEGIPAEEDIHRSGRASMATHDWRDYDGVVSPVQDQGSCASCWAFSGLGALEGQKALRKGVTDTLSKQEVIECAKNPSSGSLLGCNGGWTYSVYSHANAKSGVTTESNKPYLAWPYNSCNTATPRAPGTTVLNTWYTIAKGNEQQLKDSVYSVGPLSCTMYVSADFYYYSSGVYTDAKNYCKSTLANNHAVLVVGYGTENGIDYWLVKNSWGNWWGMGGYIKMQRGRNMCGIANLCNYPKLT